MIYITGSNGQLGFELKKLPAFKDAVFLDRSALDLSDLNQVEKFLKNTKITTLINTAAYTQVDKAESEKELALKINAEAPELMAQYGQDKNFKFVHYSTDYVFNGKNFAPYVETDITNPVNFYGESKLQGEHLIQKSSSTAIILRTSWVYSSFGKNFVKTMIRLGTEKPALNVVFDQAGTPTWAGDLALVTEELLKNDIAGTFHYSNEGVTSWYDFAREILKMKGIKTPVSPILTAEFPTPAKRPHYSVLNKNKIKLVLGKAIPHWSESLEKCLKEIS